MLVGYKLAWMKTLYPFLKNLCLLYLSWTRKYSSIITVTFLHIPWKLFFSSIRRGNFCVVSLNCQRLKHGVGGGRKVKYRRGQYSNLGEAKLVSKSFAEGSVMRETLPRYPLYPIKNCSLWYGRTIAGHRRTC